MDKAKIEQVYGVCPHDCPDSCGIISQVHEGRFVSIAGDPAHPITKGWLCAKVRPYTDHVYHPDRLLYPQHRVGPKGSGQWRQISWEEAIAEIAARWREIIAEHGPEAILPYSFSGTLGLVQMGVASARLWNRLGASQLQRSICGEAAAQAVRATLGARLSQPYEDIQHSKLIIIWGHNPVSTAPHLMPHIKQAQRRGSKLVVIDPRRTRTAKGADWHLAPKPGTDGALALGIASIIVSNGWQDEAWLLANSLGWSKLKARLADYPPERTAQITGLTVQEISDLARIYAQERPGIIKIADGLQRHLQGGQAVRAICALPAVTGQYGKRGGGLAYSTSDTIPWDNEALNHWTECPHPGRWVNMNRLGKALLGEAADPPIKSLFVFGANPAAVNPNAGLVIKGLQRDDLFTVVHELFMTDTADYADIVLPATSQLEQTDLHKGYGHTVLAYNEQAIAPLGECKSNWDMMRAIASEMGFTEPWLQQSSDQVIDEILSATASSNPALAGITRERLKAEGAVSLSLEHPVPFADGIFPTPSGKVELYSAAMAEAGLDPLPDWLPGGDDGSADGEPLDGQFPLGESLLLLSGAAHHFVSSSFANQSALLGREGAPFVEIHPEDAASRRIQDGQQVIVENGRGYCRLQARITDAVRPGVLASPKGRWQKLSGGRNVNWTTSDALGDLAGQSTYHSNRVWIRNV